jgi:hypothetical protein
VDVRAYDGSGRLLATAVTNANGAYSLGGLAAATGDKVCFAASAASAATGGTSKTGYASQCYKGVAWTGGVTIPGGLAAIPVTAGATKTGINAALLASGSITGTVTAATGGAALVDVHVAVFDKSGNVIGAALTTANGTYAVSGLQPASTGYAVCFEASFASGGRSTSGYKDQCYTSAPWTGATGPPATAKRVPVTAGKAASGVNVKLKNA